MHKKAARKMLVKLPARLHFINVFMRSFYACRSPKRKKLLELTVFFFLLLGLAHVKAARKHVDEIASTTPCLVCFLYLVSSSSNSCSIEVFREVGSGSENFSNFIFVKKVRLKTISRKKSRKSFSR